MREKRHYKEGEGANLRKKVWVGLFVMIAIITAACHTTSTLQSKTFEQIYTNKLSDVTKIEIRHGGGELKTITDNVTISKWLNDVKDIIITPSKDQEGVVGYVYYVKLFEGDHVTLEFTTSEIAGYYYDKNEQLVEQMSKLFNEI